MVSEELCSSELKWISPLISPCVETCTQSSAASQFGVILKLTRRSWCLHIPPRHKTSVDTQWARAAWLSMTWEEIVCDGWSGAGIRRFLWIYSVIVWRCWLLLVYPSVCPHVHAEGLIQTADKSFISEWNISIAKFWLSSQYYYVVNLAHRLISLGMQHSPYFKRSPECFVLLHISTKEVVNFLELLQWSLMFLWLYIWQYEASF